MPNRQNWQGSASDRIDAGDRFGGVGSCILLGCDEFFQIPEEEGGMIQKAGATCGKASWSDNI